MLRTEIVYNPQESWAKWMIYGQLEVYPVYHSAQVPGIDEEDLSVAVAEMAVPPVPKA
jgi:hypothetical protein